MVANKRKTLAESGISEVGQRRRGVSAEELRRHNLTAVLSRLHLGGPLTRSQLANQTGLNRSTIRDLIGELGELGLVEEDRGTTSNGPGRPSSVARAHPAGAVVLAAGIEVDSMAVATIGLGGHIFDQVRIPNTFGFRTPEQSVQELGRLARPLLASLPPGHTLAGVGGAVAGVVRRSDGFVHVAPNLGWQDAPLGSMIAAEVGVDRVMLANEADLGALAEFRRGAALGYRNLLYVAGEVGVGVGIIHDGKPMLGTSGYAGEAGHAMVNPGGRKCRCGSVGCWETEVGEEALAFRIGIPSEVAGEGLVEEVIRRAHAGDSETFAGLDQLGWWLGAGIGNLVNVFNPDRVVIGGFYHPLYPFLEAAVIRGAQEIALDAPWASCDLQRSDLAEDAVLIGAAELVLSEVVSDPAGFNHHLGTREHSHPSPSDSP
ncbi:MAG: ROK family protein, partial [Acidimicrobiia bacterium]